MERLIFHVDVNSAFLSWEAAKRVKEGLPDLREIPSCIGGDPKLRRSIVVAEIYPMDGEIDPGEKVRGDNRGTCGPGAAEMSGSRVRAG